MVHIKKVEIFGFKSFGSKNTQISLQPGMVSFSGPNGSGKSNVLDAIIFALGENRPKMMRVGRLIGVLHDVDGQKKTALARCSVQFDNSDRKIPLDTDRVKVVRELNAHGDNTYYLNDKKTQRSHLLNLLDVANAGIGPLNVVQQGTVTRISEFTSDEKREAIEDLVGLAYFDEKKEAAQKQLDEADRRLEIALAKMNEIKHRIDELEGERNTKLRYDMLGAEIRRLNAIAAANELASVSKARREKEDRREEAVIRAADLSKKRDDMREEIAEMEAKKSEILESADAYNKASAELEGEITEAISKHEEANARLKTATNRIPRIEERIGQINATSVEIDQRRGRIEKERKALEKSIGMSEASIQKMALEIRQAEERWSAALKRQAQLGKEKAENDKRINRLRQELESTRIAHSETMSHIQNMLRSVDSDTKRIASLRRDVVERTALLDKADATRKTESMTVQQENEEMGSLVPKIKKTRQEIEDSYDILEKADRVAARIGAQIKTIKSVMHEDYSISVLKKNAKELGIIGLVYEMISWDSKYERAILAAGSDWIKAVVVRDFETLLVLAEYARANKLPKTKMIPCKGVLPQRYRSVRGHGVYGRLADHVTYTQGCEGIKEIIFGETVLTGNRKVARMVSAEGIRAVTMSGELFEPRKTAVVVDAGSKISKLTRLISMSSSVDELQESVSLLRKYCDRRKTSLQEMEVAEAKHHKTLLAAEKRLATADQAHADLETGTIGAQKTIALLDSKVSYQKRRTESLRTRATLGESRIVSLKQQIVITGMRHDPTDHIRMNEELERLGNAKSRLEEKRNEASGLLGRERTRITIIDSQITEGENTKRRLLQERGSLESELESLREEIESLGSKKETTNAALIRLREKQQEIIAAGGGVMKDLQGYDEKIRRLHSQDQRLTEGISHARRRMDSLARDIDIMSNKTQDLLHRAGTARPEMEQESVEALLGSLKDEQESLQLRLNAAAPQAYRHVSEGYRAMSDRKNALESERNSIVKFIEDVEREKRQTFLDAFDRVDKEIRTIFSEMVSGSAWLELQNEDDIFGSGISYMVQFPHKSKRESSSLSGGEKSLAAITFVLALQKLKPSPFYLFDEVDAALDAPNSERLSKILEARSKESQFVIVSLKDSIVKKAQLIYGVYPKNGRSEILSYKDKRASLFAT